LPESLFYNTTAPGIILFLNQAERPQRKTLSSQRSREFIKGDPKNYIPEDAILRILQGLG